MVHLLLIVIYISFISLGLPDALLGAAWPIMHRDLGVDVSMAGVIAVTISMGTVASSLLSDRLTRYLGAGRVTAISVAMTAAALLGFSGCTEFWQILLWAVPYGLGAGSVDACLNNYVALHYASRHMSWLHCMWGVGASVGPYVMGTVLTAGLHWSIGYRAIGLFQILLTGVILASLPLWKRRKAAPGQQAGGEKALSMKQTLGIPGAKEVLVAFFCYCGLEQTAILWGSSYMVMKDGLDKETAASLASLFLIGMTLGRAISGFLTYKLSDTNMIRLGQGFIAVGICVMLLPLGPVCTFCGLLLIGLGCAPIYPCVIHSTPEHFGPENSQALIGVQMASAYFGSLVMPPVFGLICNHISASLLPRVAFFRPVASAAFSRARSLVSS